MIDVDEYYRKIERRMTGELKSTGQMENTFWQHVGKFMECGNRGQTVDTVYSNIERMLSGKKKHGEGQNKMTDMEKAIKEYNNK